MNSTTNLPIPHTGVLTHCLPSDWQDVCFCWWDECTNWTTTHPGGPSPAPGPSPTEEWRRPFWLMRILHTSMSRGGFLSPDRRVYVPKRVWLQKGARFIALQAKLECAEVLVTELRRVAAAELAQPKLVGKELSSL